jgi:hypothetical protein
MVYDMQDIYFADCISFRCHSKQCTEINKDCPDSESWAGSIWPTMGKVSLCMHHPIPHSAEWTQGISLSEIATACKMTEWVCLQALVKLTSFRLTQSRPLDHYPLPPRPPSHPALQEQRLLLSLSKFHFQTQKWDTEGLLTSPSMWEWVSPCNPVRSRQLPTNRILHLEHAVESSLT